MNIFSKLNALWDKVCCLADRLTYLENSSNMSSSSGNKILFATSNTLYSGVEMPPIEASGLNTGDAVRVKFYNGIVNYIVNNGSWEVAYSELVERKYSLNSLGFVPANLAEPTTDEVTAFINTFQFDTSLRNGTILTYYNTTDEYDLQNDMLFDFANNFYGSNAEIVTFNVNETELLTTPIPISSTASCYGPSFLYWIYEDWKIANNLQSNTFIDDGGLCTYGKILFFNNRGVDLAIKISIIKDGVQIDRTLTSQIVTTINTYSDSSPSAVFVVNANGDDDDNLVITKINDTVSNSNFYKIDTTESAGNSKLEHIYRLGNIGIYTEKPNAPLQIFDFENNTLDPVLPDAAIFIAGHGKKIYFGDNTTTYFNNWIGEIDGDSDLFGIRTKCGLRIYTTGSGKTNVTPSFIVNGTVCQGNTRAGFNTSTPRKDLDIVGTEGIVVPAGTIAQRGNNIIATFRFNSETSRFEGFNGTDWVTFQTI